MTQRQPKKSQPALPADKTTTCSAPPRCPIVAMGASAGGLEVFQQFFARMPADSGMAFVLVQHLDPRHETLMPQLLARYTKMPVLRVEDGLKIQANHVYVIAPNVTLTMEGCALRVAPLKPNVDTRLIDLFFRALAEDQHENVVGVVLSGTGSDGTLGLKAIKEANGLTIAQAPETAKFDSMPRSAVSTGIIDFVLPVSEIPERIIEYVKHLNLLHQRKGAEAIQQEAATYLPEIFPLLHQKTGHDFSHYKQSTLVRRIQRRMQVSYMDSVVQYIAHLHENPEAVEALFKDLLIGVTQFFRDAESFEVLAKKIIPSLFKDKRKEHQLRLWIPGCASGEEAYSFAILLAEHAAMLNEVPKIQVFATDLDVRALEVARKGKYNEEIADQISPERLQRYFKKAGATYELIGEIREMCVFSPHNLIKDPPFSRLDLISCRNLLIYFEGDLQKKLLPLFHYALNPSGYLFLGPSENVASRSELFRVIDQKYRVFQRKPTLLRTPLQLPVLGPGQVTRLQAVASQVAGVSREQNLARSIERVILEEYAPASVVINQQAEVLYFSGNTGRFLEPPAGVPSNKIVAMARKNLRLELRTAVHRAISTGTEVIRKNLSIQSGRALQQIDLIVRPLPEVGKEAELYIVIFRELTPGAITRHIPTDAGEPEDPVTRHLENELQITRENLQTTIEELETSNEELKSANEELLSMNEELQSGNEELQTSKEEIQSTNDELQRKIEEADAANAELRRAHQERAQLAAIVQNSEDAIVGKTLEGVVTSWNKAAQRIFGYTAAEMIGQSITKLIPPERLHEEDRILSQLRRGERIEHYETERVTKEGARVYVSLTSSPIRDPDGKIIGAAKIARDITEKKKFELGLQQREKLLADFFENGAIGLHWVGPDGTILRANRTELELLGYSSEDYVGHHIAEFHVDAPVINDILEKLTCGHTLQDYEARLRCKDGSIKHVVINSNVLWEDGKFVHSRCFTRDITEQKKAEESVRRSEEQLRVMADSIPQLAWMAHPDGNIFWYNRRWYDYTGTTLEQVQGSGWQTVHDPEILPLVITRWKASIETGVPFEMEFPLRGADGVFRWFLTRVNALKDAEGRVIRWFGTNTNLDQVKRSQEALKEETRVLEVLNKTGTAIASQLNLETLVQTVTDAGRELSGAKFGAFFYNVIDQNGDAFLLYTLSGAPREAFERFGHPRATALFGPTFRGEGAVRCDDVTKDPRYGQMPPHHGMPAGHLPVRSYLAVPVISRSGEVIGGLFFGHPEPAKFTERSERLIVAVAAQAAVAIDNARLYEAAQKAKSELEQRVTERTASLQETTQQLETFCYTIAHDLRSPLRAQQSFAQLLLDDYKTVLDDVGREYLGRIIASAQRLDKLVNDLLTYSRISRSELKFEKVDLEKVVKDVLGSLSAEMETQAAKVSTGPLLPVLAYEPTLNLVITNLLTNALKFLKPTESPEIRIWSEEKEGRVRIWVEDKGIGIGPENAEKIFGVFQRLHPMHKYPGTGIGLALVHKGVERMGGTVGVESELEQGSRFWIELPKA